MRECYVFLCRKVEQIAEEAESLKGSLDKYNLRNQKRVRESNERAELFRRAVRHFYHAQACGSLCLFFPLYK